jgi:hypothetical protein
MCTNDKPAHLARAARLWLALTPNEKFGVKFGMFPAGPMSTAEAEGYDGRTLCLALMDIATRQDRKRA